MSAPGRATPTSTSNLTARARCRANVTIWSSFETSGLAWLDLLVDVERLLALMAHRWRAPHNGEHVGLDMIAHRDEQPRLDYAEVITALEARFDYVGHRTGSLARLPDHRNRRGPRHPV